MALVFDFYVGILDGLDCDVDLLGDPLEHFLGVLLELLQLQNHEEADACNSCGTLTLHERMLSEIVCRHLGSSLNVMR